jgi:ABC-type lipoprotein export system ATPase subunit
MDVKEHLNFLLKKNNLNNLFNKFVFLSIITTLIIRGFYWVLILFSEIIKNKPELISQFSVILIIIFSLNIPFQKILKDITSELLKEIKLANSKFFNDKIKNMKKSELLNFNLTEYHITLNNFNDNLEQFILNKKNEYEIPFYYITLLIIAINKQNGLLIVLFAVFYIVIRTLNELKLSEEALTVKESIVYDNNIRNYITNSKIYLMNNQLNDDYLLNNLNKFEESKLQIHQLYNLLNYKSNVTMLLFIIIIIASKIKDLNQYDFFYYFLIIYDIEYIAEKMTEYYKSKVINKMQERLNFLYNINSEEIIVTNVKPIKQIVINQLKNYKPKIEITNQIIINTNDHILINGSSGSGKTSLLYILKGILIPNILNIEPSINDISVQSYISIPNNKNMFSNYLYNIITNYETNPNIELINYALKQSKIDHILNENIYINTEKLSSGERIRLYISHIIYTVKTNNFNILLFDEIDENLNDTIAQEICMNIKEVFKDKIILYISHNDSIEKYFKKKIFVIDGIINNIKLINQ